MEDQIKIDKDTGIITLPSVYNIEINEFYTGKKLLRSQAAFNLLMNLYNSELLIRNEYLLSYPEIQQSGDYHFNNYMLLNNFIDYLNDDLIHNRTTVNKFFGIRTINRLLKCTETETVFKIISTYSYDNTFVRNVSNCMNENDYKFNEIFFNHALDDNDFKVFYENTSKANPIVKRVIDNNSLNKYGNRDLAMHILDMYNPYNYFIRYFRSTLSITNPIFAKKYVFMHYNIPDFVDILFSSNSMATYIDTKLVSLISVNDYGELFDFVSNPPNDYIVNYMKKPERDIMISLQKELYKLILERIDNDPSNRISKKIIRIISSDIKRKRNTLNSSTVFCCFKDEFIDYFDKNPNTQVKKLMLENMLK